MGAQIMTQIKPASFRDAPFREAQFMPVALDVERRDNGTVILRSRVELGEYEPNLALAFSKTAERCGAKPALAVRNSDESWLRSEERRVGKECRL